VSGGMGLRGRVRRLERKAKGETVSIEQREGMTATFPKAAFWLGLFVVATDAACGVVPEGPVVDALNNATPEARGRIERIVASGQAGDFLRGNGEGGLLEVADPVEDLSEQV
jgi:hypothetical protein